MWDSTSPEHGQFHDQIQSALDDNDRDDLQEEDILNESIPSSRPASVSISRALTSDAQFLIPKQQNTTCFVVVLATLSAVGGFLFGYDTGIVAGAIILVKDEFQLNSVWQEAFISVTLGAAALSAILSGYANDRFGRKPTIMVSSVVFAVGAILLGAATTRWELILGRAILGIGIGFASATFPMYIAENAPSHLRGLFVTLNTMFITGGQLVAGIVAGIFSFDQHNGWRYMLGIAAIPAVFQFIGFLFMPESARWLVKKGRLEEACVALQRIRGDADIGHEIDEIERYCEETRADSGSTIFRILRTPHVRWALFIGVMLQFFQQIVGINTVMYYSATIIKMSGVRSTVVAIWLSALVASGNLCFGFIGLYLVDKIGRRPLVLASIAGTMFSLMVLAVGFQLAASHTPDVTTIEINNSPNVTQQCSNYTSCNACTYDLSCGFCYDTSSQGDVFNGSCMAVGVNEMNNEPDVDYSLYGRCSNITQSSSNLVWAYEYCPNPFAWMAVLGLLLYVALFAPGMGPMPWTINSEIYPIWARSTGNSISTCVNWLSNVMVSMTFLTLTEAITRHGAFWLYSSLAALGFIFMFLFLPETKGKHLEEVEQLFKGYRFIPCAGRRRASTYERLDNIINDDQ